MSSRLFSVTQGGLTVRSFGYDGAGNLTSDDRSGTLYAYAINDAGRIKQASIGGTPKAAYLYDHKSRLSVRQTLNMVPSGTGHLVHDHRDQMIAEMNPATGEAVREYVWIEDLPVAVLDGQANPSNPMLSGLAKCWRAPWSRSDDQHLTQRH